MLRLPPFRLLSPATLAEASRRLLDLGPRASLMAGGTDLVPRFKRRQTLPEVVVSLHRVKGFAGIRADRTISRESAPEPSREGMPKVAGERPAAEHRWGAAEGRGVSIGAGTTLAQVASDPLLSRYAALKQAAESAATPQIRSIATIGGNLCLPPRCSYYDKSALWRQAQGSCLRSGSEECHVAPGAKRCMAVYSGDLAPALLALGARARLACGTGERIIPIEELFADDGIAPLAKKPEEILAEVHLDRSDGPSVYLKLRRRSSFDYPSLGVAAAASFDADGRVRECRIALGGVGPAPVVARDAGRLLVGERLEPEVVAAAAEAAARLVRPVENSDFSASYRKRMAGVFVSRALRELTGLS